MTSLHQRSVGGTRRQEGEGVCLTGTVHFLKLIVLIFFCTVEDGGLRKLTLKEGTGAFIPPNTTAIVHYTGRLVDGTVFDSSKDRGKPFSFDVGKGHVILGWDKGVATMSKGEICLLTCKPEYAYGNSQMGPIPANSTLIFEVELLDWKTKTTASEMADKAIYVMTAVVLLLAGYIYFSRLGYF